MSQAQGTSWHLFVPKLISVLRRGYGLGELRRDVIAGLTVSVVALPLAMALAIASGTTPDKGLVTAIVAGFLISALGGSRYQIGGPTGAFVVVVFGVIAEHGYDGLIIATLMAGVMLIVAGYARLGTFIKYIPQPVVTGFTAGIAVIIFSSQVPDLLGLTMAEVPAEFVDKWRAVAAHLGTLDPATLAVAAAALGTIVWLRRWRPSLPGFLIAVVGCAAAVAALDLPVATIGSRFGGLPRELALPEFPDVSPARLAELLPSAFTIAFLAGVEALLSAVVADGMTGARHRSNCELVAQGVANCASSLVGGLPATGAIARTATNVRAGAVSPVSGMLHAAFLLLFVLVAAPLAAYVPMAALAAVLVVVAWNMSEVERFRHLMSAPVGDRAVLLITFALTVLVDLTVAIEVGVVLAAILFMHRMAGAVAIQSHVALIEEEEDDLADTSRPLATMRAELPEGVEAFQIKGPFFFGVAARLGDTLDQIARPPRVLILRLRLVPLIDATGVAALGALIDRCQRHGTRVILSGLQEQPGRVLRQMALAPQDGRVSMVGDFTEAVAVARRLVAGEPEPRGRDRAAPAAVGSWSGAEGGAAG